MDLTTMWKIGTSLQIFMASGSLVASLGLAIMIVRKTRSRALDNKPRAEEIAVSKLTENQSAGNFQDARVREEGGDQGLSNSSELPWKRVKEARRSRSKDKEGNPLIRIMFCIAVSDVLQSLGILLGMCEFS